MKHGLNRFEFYLDKLETLLQSAAAEINPALFLYQNNFRTPLFMVEGLSKLYASLHNRKKFEKIREHLKVLEDTLGSIDYYDGFYKEFEFNDGIPPSVKSYLQAQTREKIQRLNDLLISERWFSDRKTRIETIRDRLSDIDWEKPKNEISLIEDFYRKSIKDIKLFIPKNGFSSLENQVHELRRKLRWLSIYPQALQGAIQLKPVLLPEDYLSKYLVAEIVNSPFNVMPRIGENKWLLLLNKEYFLALSWMIAELGKLKDNGLKIMVVQEAFEQTQGLKAEEAFKKSILVLHQNPECLENILQKSTQISHEFFAEKNLDNLINSIVKV